MAVAISVLCSDRAYYYEARDNSTVLVSKNSAADIVISDLDFELAILVNKNEAIIRYSNNKEIKAPFDRFVILDNDSQLAAYLSETSNEEKTVRLPETGEWLLGRSGKLVGANPVNQIVVGLPFISSTHCKFVREKGITSVIDSGSKNGLFLNGKRVNQARLCDGDVVSIFTVQIVLRGDNLIFRNVGPSFKAEKLKGQTNHKAAPKKTISDKDFQFIRSPRMISQVDSREITLEKPPQSSGTPQINWVNVLVTPAISVLLMLVMVIAMGMNAAMLIMSGVMSIVSAVVVILPLPSATTMVLPHPLTVSGSAFHRPSRVASYSRTPQLHP